MATNEPEVDGAASGTERFEDEPGENAPVPVVVAATRSRKGRRRVLRLTGTGFRASSTVEVNGVHAAATFVNAKEIVATLTPKMAAAVPLVVKVTTPPPGGGTSIPVTATADVRRE